MTGLVSADPTIAPDATHPDGGANYYPCIYGQGRAIKLAFWAFNHQWSMNRGGYFFQWSKSKYFFHITLHLLVTMFKQKTNTMDYMGYHSWTDNTAQKGMPGVSFGQKNMFFR